MCAPSVVTSALISKHKQCMRGGEEWCGGYEGMAGQLLSKRHQGTQPHDSRTFFASPVDPSNGEENDGFPNVQRRKGRRALAQPKRTRPGRRPCTHAYVLAHCAETAASTHHKSQVPRTNRILSRSLTRFGLRCCPMTWRSRRTMPVRTLSSRLPMSRSSYSSSRRLTSVLTRSDWEAVRRGVGASSSGSSVDAS